MLSGQIFAQTNPITGITISLPANPDANVANWGTGTPFIITAKTASGKIDPSVAESKILVIIKKGRAKICGAYTINTAPAANFNMAAKVWSGGNAVAFLGADCKLPPADYELSVQFFGSSNGKLIPLSNEITKQFSVKREVQIAKKEQALSIRNLQPIAKQAVYYPLNLEIPREPVNVGDTLYFQFENKSLSSANPLSYTIKNSLSNKTSAPTKVINRQGLIRIALPLQNSVVQNGETGILIMNDFKRYYYISFKRN